MRFNLKINKSPGFGKLQYMQMQLYAYNEIKAPLMNVLRNSIDNRSFPNKNENWQD